MKTLLTKIYPCCLLCIFILFGMLACKSSKIKAEQERLKKEHEAKLAMWKVMPEPFEKEMPDSLKKWIPIFRKIKLDDQKHRVIGIGMDKKSMAEQHLLDSINLKLVCAYIDQYGWPIYKQHGLFVTQTVFMVIQHADLVVQEKYYPAFSTATDNDSLQLHSLIMLEDRINMRRNRYQYYGSQVVIYKGKQVLYPVVNIDSVDIWRKRTGSIPIADYMKLLGATWDVNEYKKLLPELEKAYNITDRPGLHYIFKDTLK